MTHKFNNLPRAGEPTEEGLFLYVDDRNGKRKAVVLLPEHYSNLTYDEALKLAEQMGAKLPDLLDIAAMSDAVPGFNTESCWFWMQKAELTTKFGVYPVNTYNLQLSEGMHIHPDTSGTAVFVRHIPLI